MTRVLAQIGSCSSVAALLPPTRPARAAMRTSVRTRANLSGPENLTPPPPSKEEITPELPAAVQQTIPPQPAPTAKGSTSFTDIMAFTGAAPEIVNGRLAMLAFVAAAGAELATGSPVAEQFKIAPFYVTAISVVFIVASLVPLFKGKTRESVASGFWNPTAELLNGRAAMLGFFLLLVQEWAKGSALF